MKKNKKKLFTNIAIASALSFAVVGVGVVTIYNNDYQVTKAVEYDDDDRLITLSSDELNNYTFENFYHCIDDYFAFNDFYLVYNDNTYDPNSDDYGAFNYYYDTLGYYISFVYDLDTYNTERETDFEYNYTFHFNVLDGFDDFSYSLVIDLSDFNETQYGLFKSAIELDIQANQPRGMGGAMQDFISLLTGGIVRLANGIATGVADFAKALFLQVDSGGAVTGLSIFGGIVAIFAGLALAVGITTKVYTWITSLGN